ncbi:MFS transporter [Halobacillus kuroshimensis]|uniref:MFS transporter n=1 Tax=Halobacillus kuroshimensis TaxID=302481 RepID=A0ABS3E0L4_9BACI|nr:MFS transporter [Halobacillus kuroshimensis]MBN8237094.1 MFS transporter [Halobacillus kuroshimensis]
MNSRTDGSPFYYGWVIVFIAGLSVFFSGPGQTYSISIFIDYYIDDFDYTRSLVSGIYSGATLAAGFILFMMGRLIDRFGQRAMMVAVGMCLALALFWNAFLAGPVMMFIGFFLIRLFGQGSMTLIPNTLVPQWFIRKRGRALSVMAIGGFASSALLPPLNTWLIEAFGWRMTWGIWGTALLVIFVPLAFYLVRNRPEDIGEVPDGSRKPADGQEIKNPNVEVDEKSWTLKEAMATKAFWFILFCVTVPALVNTAITFHMVSIMELRSLDAGVAAMVLTLMAVVGFPVTFISGWLVDRFRVHYILAVTFFGHILTLLLLLLVTDSWAAAVGFGCLWGVVNGFERIVLNIVWPNYFGRAHLGSIKGLAQTVMVIGSALGPLPFGIFYDWLGGYQEIIVLTVLFPVTATVLALLSPQPDYAAYHG